MRNLRNELILRSLASDGDFGNCFRETIEIFKISCVAFLS